MIARRLWSSPSTQPRHVVSLDHSLGYAHKDISDLYSQTPGSSNPALLQAFSYINHTPEVNLKSSRYEWHYKECSCLFSINGRYLKSLFIIFLDIYTLILGLSLKHILFNFYLAYWFYLSYSILRGFSFEFTYIKICSEIISLFVYSGTLQYETLNSRNCLSRRVMI